MNNATAAVVDGKLEPVTKQEPAKQDFLKGQYLFDTFMAPTEGEQTRMGLVRDWAKGNQLDAFGLKGACDKMVEIAREKDTATGSRKLIPVLGSDGQPVTKKDGTPKTTAERGTLEQQAMNVRTVLQQAWGALKYAPDQLIQEGYTDQTGYNAMRVIAKRALDKRGIDWKGDALKTDADKERAKANRMQQEAKAVLADTMKSVPMLPGENLLEYNRRIAELAEQGVVRARAEAESAYVEKAVADISKRYGAHRLEAIAQAIFSQLGISGWEQESHEPTDEEVATAMANVSEEQAAH